MDSTMLRRLTKPRHTAAVLFELVAVDALFWPNPETLNPKPLNSKPYKPQKYKTSLQGLNGSVTLCNPAL